MNCRVLVVCIGLFVPASLHGQRLDIPSYESTGRPAVSPAHLFGPAVADSALPRTYWLEGGLIGGVGLGVFGVLLARDLSESRRSTFAGTVLPFAIGASVGFPLGALIGGQIRKDE